MEILGARPVWSMSDSEKLSTLDAVVAEEARLKTLRWQLTASLDQSGCAQELGSGDTARLLSERYRQDLRDARRDVRIANRLATYTATSEALPAPSTPFPNSAHATDASSAAGATHGDDAVPDDDDSSETGHDGTHGGWRVNPDQAAAIIGILDRVPPSVPLEDLEVAEQQLIGLAATHTPEQLRSAGRVIRDLLDPDGPEPDEKAAYARESLTLKTADRGLTFKGYLANENAELFRTLIHAHSRPHRTADGDLDPRPHSKRQADALSTILTVAGQSTQPSNTQSGGSPSPGSAETSEYGDVLPLPSDRPTDRGGPDTRSGAGGEVPGHGVKPQISVTIDYNDLRTAPANATGALVFGDNLSAAAVRRLACDAEILPIVLGSKSQPLDVGTSQRLVTRPMRRALNARDKGCVVCGAPPIQCEAHHIIHWADGGITAVSNLALLCKRHHIDLHSGHWRIRILDGVVHVTRPTWADPARIPPGRYRPPAADITHQPPTPPPSTWDPWSDDPLPQRPTNPAPLTPPLDPDPWGDARPPRSTKTASLTPLTPDPWGDDARPPRSTKTASLTPLTPDPWGDDEPRRPPKSQQPPPTDPWGDDDVPAPLRHPSATVVTDPWGDDVPA